MDKVSIICLEPWGNQDFDYTDIYEGSSKGTFLYLVHEAKDVVYEAIDVEELNERQYSKEIPHEEYDKEYCKSFESMLEEAGIKYTRLPDKCFGIYSTLM